MRFFVGCYTRLGGPGVGLCELEGDSLRLIETASGLLNPTYVILSGDRKTLYATGSSGQEEATEGCVAAFDLSDGHLRLASLQPTGGRAACHLTLSPDERFLYVANYASGSLAAFPVRGTQIGPRVQLIAHEGAGPVAGRQDSAHTHCVAFDPEDERLLYAVDLGMDAVMIYRQDADSGLLTARERLDMPAGMGPRHLLFHENMMYVAHELGSAVSAFQRTASGWRLTQTLSTLPDGWQGVSYAAAIRLMGGLLFVSNRGHDSLAVFRVRLGGSLSLEGVYPTMGLFPRDFSLLADGRVLVAHQNSGDVRLMSFMQTAPGLRCLVQQGDPLPYPGAVCVCPLLEEP